MRSSKHFEKGGDRRAGGGKIAAFTGGTMSFGAKSAKTNSGDKVEVGAAQNGGLSMAQLEEHNKRMDQIVEEEEKG